MSETSRVFYFDGLPNSRRHFPNANTSKFKDPPRQVLFADEADIPPEGGEENSKQRKLRHRQRQSVAAAATSMAETGKTDDHEGDGERKSGE